MTDRCVLCCQARNGLECESEYCDTYETYQQGRADEQERIMSIVARCIAHNVYNVTEGKNLLDEIRDEIAGGGDNE